MVNDIGAVMATIMVEGAATEQSFPRQYSLRYY